MSNDLLFVNKELIALAKLAELLPFLDDLSEADRERLADPVETAGARLDAMVRAAKGWGVGDTVRYVANLDPKNPVLYLACSYFLSPNGFLHIRLRRLKKDGTPSKVIAEWNTVDAGIVKHTPAA